MHASQHQGLTDEQVAESRNRHGKNVLKSDQQNRVLKLIKEIVFEPLFIILILASVVYFLLGEINEGIIMLTAILLVSAISLYQENKSQNAIALLKNLSDPKAKVIRNFQTIHIPIEDLVLGDYILVEDGDIIPADARILETHDFSVNESTLTGESLAIFKTLHNNTDSDFIFKGTLVITGSCIAEVIALAKESRLGKIGASMNLIQDIKTPLQLQIKKFVQSMVIAGLIVFVIVFIIHWYLSASILNGLLQGLTLAMSILPEEIPVAFSTFMALGAYQLQKQKVIATNPHAVETLGAVSVICTDKTGTITENKMELVAIYDYEENKTIDLRKSIPKENKVLEYAMWSSETQPFDAMEISIHKTYELSLSKDLRKDYVMIHEYPLGGNPPMMTHVFENKSGSRIIAVKGSLEAVMNHSPALTEENKKIITEQSKQFASKGYRVLGVGCAQFSQEEKALPVNQEDYEFIFLGLLAFYDPPKENIKDILQQFYTAGIGVKMITGDYPETAMAIARQIEMKDTDYVLTGKQISEMSNQDLQTEVRRTTIFARMYPEAKLRIIEALKANGDVVAMTGDGVNDGPALKAAHIGIAMGKRGSELAKQTAALILMDDDLKNMTYAVAMGRRIYENLKKAIQYIISIHIPIILIVTLPLLLNWAYPTLFTPVHVIFLELVMGPICSIVFEREPIEKDSMKKAPRKISNRIFSIRELFQSIVQGVMITVFCLGIGYYFMKQNKDLNFVRTIVYATLIFSNLFLTLVNRSFVFSVIESFKFKNRYLPLFLGLSLLVLFLSIYHPFMRNVFEFSFIPFNFLFLSFVLGFLSVIWIEIPKYLIRKTISKAAVK